MFSKRCFSEWCAERVVRIRKGRRHQNALKHWCFEAIVCPSEGVEPLGKPKKGPKRKVHMSFAPIFVNSGVFPWENKHDSHWTFVPECPCEKFMNWPFFGLVCWGHSWSFSAFSCPHFPRCPRFWSVESPQTLLYSGWEGPSAFSAFSPYRVWIADFENPTDRLYCDRP